MSNKITYTRDGATGWLTIVSSSADESRAAEIVARASARIVTRRDDVTIVTGRVNRRERAAIDQSLGTSAAVPAPSDNGGAGWRHRRLFALGQQPPASVTVDGRSLALTGRGRAFPIGADDPSVHGEHLLGREGSLGSYAYYR